MLAVLLFQFLILFLQSAPASCLFPIRVICVICG